MKFAVRVELFPFGYATPTTIGAGAGLSARRIDAPSATGPQSVFTSRAFSLEFALVTKRHHAALIAFDLRQMKGDISIELLEEGDPVTYQDRQDRITNFVGKAETKAFARKYPTSNKPDVAERWPQTPIHEMPKIAGAELDGRVKGLTRDRRAK